MPLLLPCRSFHTFIFAEVINNFLFATENILAENSYFWPYFFPVLWQFFSKIGHMTSRMPEIMLKITNYCAKCRNFYNVALIFLKTAGNYDFSHILAELTAYWKIFISSPLPGWGGAVGHNIFGCMFFCLLSTFCIYLFLGNIWYF